MSSRACTAVAGRFADMTDARGRRMTETDSADTSTRPAEPPARPGGTAWGAVGSAQRGGHVQRARSRHAGHPDPLCRKGVRRRGEDLRHWPVGADPAGRVEHDQAIDLAHPGGQPMLDHHQRRPRGANRGRDRLTDHRGGRRVEHRGRLVQQHQSRRQRENAGQRQPLGLAAGERVGGVALVVREAHGSKRRPDPGPDLVTRHTEVLGAEGHVATRPSGDQRVSGVLHHQADRRACGWRPVDEDRAGEVARLGRGQDPRKRAQERGLPEPLGPASSTREPAATCRLIPARTGSRRPKGRQVRSHTSTRAPCATAAPRGGAVRQGATHGLPDLAGRR